MKKLAVLISGEYRKFDVTRKTMAFLDNIDIDVYFSTWDKTVYSSPKINLLKEETITEERILQDLGRPAIIKIDKHDSFTEKKYNSKMINRWKTGFNLIENSGIKYEYVAIIRPDIFFTTSPTPEFINLERYENSIGFAWATSLDKCLLPDVLFVSKFNNIKKLMSALSSMAWTVDSENDWHKWWYKFVNERLEILHINELSYLTFCRLWATNENVFHEIIDIQHDWRDLRLLYESEAWGRENILKVWPQEIVETAEEKWKNNYFDKYK